MWEIYAQGKEPYEGENPREVLRQVCNPRVNRRPVVPRSCPPKMLETIKRCWHANPESRPQAKDLDTFFTDINVRDAEPLTDADHARGQHRTGDMLYEGTSNASSLHTLKNYSNTILAVFPKHIADLLKNGEKVEPETHDMVTVVFSDIVNFTDISKSLSASKVCARE